MSIEIEFTNESWPRLPDMDWEHVSNELQPFPPCIACLYLEFFLTIHLIKYLEFTMF